MQVMDVVDEGGGSDLFGGVVPCQARRVFSKIAIFGSTFGVNDITSVI
jgi:hypothetical protein